MAMVVSCWLLVVEICEVGTRVEGKYVGGGGWALARAEGKKPLYKARLGSKRVKMRAPVEL